MKSKIRAFPDHSFRSGFKSGFKSRFTLIEVVISLAILSISIASLLGLITASQNRLSKSYDLWRRTHILMQAGEYYMLMPKEDPPAMPEMIFPYTDYAVDVSYEEVEGLPDDYTSLVGQLPLTSLKLELRRQSDGHVVDQIYIDRLDYESSSAD